MIEVTDDLLNFMTDYLAGKPEAVKTYEAGLKIQREKQEAQKKQPVKQNTPQPKKKECNCKNHENRNREIDELNIKVLTITKQLSDTLELLNKHVALTNKKIAALEKKNDMLTTMINELADDFYVDEEDDEDYDEEETPRTTVGLDDLLRSLGITVKKPDPQPDEPQPITNNKKWYVVRF